MLATAVSLSTAKDEDNKGDGGDRGDESGLVRPYLVVEWADSTTPAATGRGGDADDVINGIDGTAKITTTRSIYDVEWLMRFRNDELSRAWRRRRTEVRPAHAIRYGRPPMRLSASEEEEEKEKKAVVGERDAINAAYTSDGLRMHQDLAYYESPPGLQFLHCVANGPGVDGGESTLIDGMAAAYRLRELRPDSFETLVRCPATFVKQRDGACMTMLHGRRKFSAVEGASFDESQRHLMGCYTNIDDTLNLYRVLLRERGCASTSILNVGNGTSIIP
ncbi:hypothetical protein ACHAW5_008744 [Stephanodiscus triporus]|uniref:TauD/TfdA-like domain-containing protein n=1 Tax=Stephanodiscus triporus TaxID=2934178 RepID=A0ABD3P7Q2_9STRA